MKSLIIIIICLNSLFAIESTFRTPLGTYWSNVDMVFGTTFGGFPSPEKFWLLPMIITLLLFGLLLFFTSGTAIAPFIYTQFSNAPECSQSFHNHEISSENQSHSCSPYCSSHQSAV